MLTNISRAQVAGAWVATIVVVMACSVVAGAPVTVGAAELWLVAGAVPPGVMLLLWHRAPPLTAAEVLYSTTNPSTHSRP